MFKAGMRNWSTPLLMVLVVLAALAATAGCNGAAPTVTDPGATNVEVPPELQRVAQAYSILLQEHVDHSTLDAEQLTDGAIRGLLMALEDPHASYLSAEQHTREQEGYRGFFEGIGAQVSLTEAGVTVIAPIPGAPAEAAGILTGDVILAVDGESIEGLTLIEAVNRIRGPGGTQVTLLIRHLGSQENVNISVTRGRIPIESTSFRMLDNGVGHLWIYSFSNTTEDEVRRAIQQFEDANGRGLILDLRNNPGGLLHAVVSVSDLFLDGGEVLYEIDAQGDQTNHDASGGGPASEIPMVVLVNQFSASASEILAGAIKTAERAPVIGATTYGKGSVNITRELSDGSAIYFTIRRWYLPDGTQIEGQGVTPTVEFESDVRQLPIDPAEDDALQKAAEVLEQQLSLQ
jgi:carboxyl-terminal processing protease